MYRFFVAGLTFLFLFAAVAPAQEPDSAEDAAAGASDPAAEKLAAEASGILKRYCVRCHKGEGSESGYAFDVADVTSMIDGFVLVEGSPDDSSIHEAIFEGKMPPKNRPQLPRPTPKEAEIVKAWIESGAAPPPPVEPRTKVTLAAELQAISQDLFAASRDERVSRRYFSLANLHNDATVDRTQLEMARTAFAKALNSLSWEADLVVPIALDEAKTIYRIDLYDLGWGRDHWNALLRAYPYAVSYGGLDEIDLKELDEKIVDLRGGDRSPAVVRADWFVSVATKPPLYHTLLYDLYLPSLVAREEDPHDPANPKSMTDADLERHLGIDVAGHIRSGRAQRSGFTESGVSGQNRLIERHPFKGGRGFYWKSYDFRSSNRTSILGEFPLGPAFDGNPFQELAFAHDGGEIIFTLPNGLQAYLLIDGEGKRIDAGPIDVVSDSLKTSGDDRIVTGLSCIACHRVGMIESPDDEVRKFSSALGDARDHVRLLYPENAALRASLSKDGEIFRSAMEEVLQAFPVAIGEGEASLEELPEPVGETARRFLLQPMELETVAAELFVEPDRLRAALESDPTLRRLGLRTLLRDGGTIKRAMWESPAEFPLMKQVARQFGYGAR